MSEQAYTPSPEFLAAYEKMENATDGAGQAAAVLRDIRKELGGPPDTCGGERGRRISIAITHLETAELWLRAAAEI